MGKITKLRDLINAIKDKASQSKAAIICKPCNLSLHLAVLRATTHAPSNPPEDHHISTLLTVGDSSRATASSLIVVLMDRLHRTRDSTVALKCLLIIHHIIKRGPFILQDQLSIFPATGGYNYLKLSNFRDGATTATWQVSAWVRFYARYLETLLFTSRILGYMYPMQSYKWVPSTCTQSLPLQQERIPTYLNSDLIKDVDSLVGMIEETCKVPDSLSLQGNKLLYDVMVLLGNDYLSTVNELLIRLGEFKERLSCLSFGESVELGFILKRLGGCEDRLSVLFSVKKPCVESLWSLITELSVKIEDLKVSGPKLLTFGKGCESARFGNPVLTIGDSVRFSSDRFQISKVKTF